jgi:hypothetical protein
MISITNSSKVVQKRIKVIPEAILMRLIGDSDRFQNVRMVYIQRCYIKKQSNFFSYKLFNTIFKIDK